MTPPQKLYKFCPINPKSLKMVLKAQVYHALPSTFNDPLDCNPSLEVDITSAQLTALLEKMMQEQGFVASDIRSEISRIQYFSTDITDQDDMGAYEESFSYQLGEEIRRTLIGTMGKRGVLSLSERWDEPLLWSHYAEQHQGMCVEFDATACKLETLKPVNYNAPRSIRANDLFRWKCHGDSRAEERVADTFFYAKAPNWSYEKEWRDISNNVGPKLSNFDLTAVHFGMRTDPIWKWLLIKTLHLDRQVTLYDIMAAEKSFALERYEIDRDEIEQRGIDQPTFRVFQDLPEDWEPESMSVGERAVRGLLPTERP